MHRSLLLALFLAGCTAAPVITPEPLMEPLDVESQGQLPPAGWCTEYIGPGNCSPDAGTATFLCSRMYGEAFATPMECWQSVEAAQWGCVPLCGVSITCTGAEVPSALWCCPW